MLGAKFKTLSVPQHKPLEEQNFNYLRILNGNYWTTFVEYHLSCGPKHPIRDEFNHVQFVADMDKLVRKLRESGTNLENYVKL